MYCPAAEQAEMAWEAWAEQVEMAEEGAMPLAERP